MKVTKKIASNAIYSIKDPGNFYPTIRREVQLLYDNRCYTTCTVVIMCCLDAFAAGKGEAGRGKFEPFVQKNFLALCNCLDGTVPGKTGAEVLYDKYRNGFAHLFSPKSDFAIAQDSELDGCFVGRFEVEGTGKTLVAINVDRLIREFLVLVNHLEQVGV